MRIPFGVMSSARSALHLLPLYLAPNLPHRL